MPGLDDLPDELLSRICDELIILVPNRKQFSLLPINKRLYRILLPLVWRDITIINRRRLHRKFCAALVLRKSTASLIHTISVDSSDPEGDSCAYRSKKQGLSKKWGINDEDVVDQLSARAVTIFGDDEKLCKRWRTGIEVQDTAFMVPLMLVHLPNLEKLHMNNDASDSKTWGNLGAISKRMLGDDRIPAHQKPFSKLRNFVLDAEMDNHGYYSQPLSVAALWPALESMRAHCIGSSEDDDDDNDDDPEPAFMSLSPRSSNLSTLQLFPMCQISPSQLQSLVGTSRGLRVFRYCIGLAWEWSIIEISEIQEALDLQKETLEDLTLCLQLGELRHCNDETHHFYPMDFTRYRRLTHLCIGAAFLYNRWAGSLTPDRLVNCLPACIQILRIVHVEQENELKLLAHCLTVLFQQKSKFPNLKALDVGVLEQQIPKTQYDTIQASVEAAALNAGVRVRFFAYTDPDSERGSILSQMGVFKGEKKEEEEEEEESDARSVVSFEDPDDDGWITGAEHSDDESGSQGGASEDDSDQDDDDDDGNDDDEDEEDGWVDEDDEDPEGQIEDDESQGDDASGIESSGNHSDAEDEDESEAGSEEDA